MVISEVRETRGAARTAQPPKPERDDLDAYLEQAHRAIEEVKKAPTLVSTRWTPSLPSKRPTPLPTN